MNRGKDESEHNISPAVRISGPKKALSMFSLRQELEQINHVLKQKYRITVQLKRHLMSFYDSKQQQCECRCRVNVHASAHCWIMIKWLVGMHGDFIFCLSFIFHFI